MLIVILARGHGSGRVDKQCSSSDGSSCWRRYAARSWAVPLLRVACSLGRLISLLDELPVLRPGLIDLGRGGGRSHSVFFRCVLCAGKVGGNS